MNRPRALAQAEASATRFFPFGMQPPSATPPPQNRRPGFAPGARLVVFTVRHLSGLFVFGWLTTVARQSDPDSSLWWFVAGLTVLYLVVAVFGWFHLFDVWQRRRRHPR